mmetsp:Transcript_11209/g.32341  ORF Transcript_11209/g.32341 Transcript_11209/m.32341 type:complete len:341 (+) Transcript_11209:348-1370(+)
MVPENSRDASSFSMLPRANFIGEVGCTWTAVSSGGASTVSAVAAAFDTSIGGGGGGKGGGDPKSNKSSSSKLLIMGERSNPGGALISALTGRGGSSFSRHICIFFSAAMVLARLRCLRPPRERRPRRVAVSAGAFGRASSSFRMQRGTGVGGFVAPGENEAVDFVGNAKDRGDAVDSVGVESARVHSISGQAADAWAVSANPASHAAWPRSRVDSSLSESSSESSEPLNRDKLRHAVAAGTIDGTCGSHEPILFGGCCVIPRADASLLHKSAPGCAGAYDLVVNLKLFSASPPGATGRGCAGENSSPKFESESMAVAASDEDAMHESVTWTSGAHRLPCD